MSQVFIEDAINDEFLRWEKGKRYFISAQTGSGKTTFMFERVIPYYLQRGMKVVYLVNRRVLKDQLSKTADSMYARIHSSIGGDFHALFKIATYQEIEQGLINNSGAVASFANWQAMHPYVQMHFLPVGRFLPNPQILVITRSGASQFCDTIHF